jgi:UPF0271 protein
MKLVIDSSAILSGRELPIDAELYIVPAVMRELRHDNRLRQKLRYLEEVRLKVETPTPRAIDEVKLHATKTGDIKRLSPTDIKVLALALDLNATILTDDYSIQNLAVELGLTYKPVAEAGISEKIYWKYRCKGCSKYWDEPYIHCPICGSSLKTTRTVEAATDSG